MTFRKLRFKVDSHLLLLIRPPRRPLIIYAEIWPGAVDVDFGLHPIRDAAQVLSLARWCARLDERSCLDAIFRQPTGLGADEDHRVRSEEGWLLMPVEEQPCLAAGWTA